MTALVIAVGASLAMTHAASSIDHRAPREAASSAMANPAIGWETTIRELSVGP